MPLKKTLKTTAVLAAVLSPSIAFADGPIGFVGAGVGFGDVLETRGTDSRLRHMPLFIEGQVSFSVMGNGRLGASAFLSSTDWDQTQLNFDTDVPDAETRLALQYTHALTNDLTLGAFGVYTRSSLVTDDLQREPYETLYGGISAQYFVGNDLMVFGQAGVGDTLAFPIDQNPSDPEGFNDGYFLRAGATWFPVDSTSLTFDYEMAHAGVYQNGGSDADSGDFYSVGLSGETALPVDMPLTATYFIRRDHYESAAGTDLYATDLTFGFGIRFLFGADTPRDHVRAGRMLDAPRLPARAVDWQEVLD